MVITINGSNDTAIIGGATLGTVIEAGGTNNDVNNSPVVSGTLTSSDVDDPDDVFQAQVTTAGAYGDFEISTGGVWIYTLDNTNADVEALNTGDTLTDLFVVYSVDGTSQSVSISIQGSNDSAQISGVKTGVVVEAGGIGNNAGGSPVASGILMAADKDNLANLFQTVPLGASSYGNYQVLANGVWVYVLNNSIPAVQNLNAGDALTDNFTAYTVDGTPQVVSITINGTADVKVDESGPDIQPEVTTGDKGNETVQTSGGAPASQSKTDTVASRSRTRFDSLTSTADALGTVNLEGETVRGGIVASAQSTLMLQGSQGFISRLRLTPTQGDYALLMDKYDFNYTFQASSLTLLQQIARSSGEDDDAANIGLAERGEGGGGAPPEFTTKTAAQAAGISVALGVTAWALRSGGLLAAMVSSLPAWRQVDLLPILGDPEKRKIAREEDSGSEAAREEHAVDRMLGKRTESGGD